MTDTATRNGILICGAYGLGNAGDEAILSAILREVRTVAPGAEITVLSRNPEETAARNGVEALYFFDLPGMHRVLRRTRLYINGGGSLIQDATSRRSLWYYLYTLHAAKKHGCRVLMYGCGIGPVTYRGDRNLTRRVLNRCADMITLRESDSLRELNALRVTKPEIILSADPALTLSPAPEAEVDAVLERAGIPPRGRYLCLALRNWKGYDKKAPVFGAAARYAWEQYGLTPVFVSIEKRQDPAAHRPAAAALGDIPHYFLDDAGDTGTIIGALSRMEVIVSMRLHALIFAAGQGIPLVGAVYDPKVSAFLRYLGEDLFADLDTLSEASLCALLDKAVSRAGHPEAQARMVERLRAIEGRNTDAVRRLWER
ncbi:MAG: polysaccharide pyruvyl transferase CsaB [Oscillibacter sp.]|nr:polysaccharide pyruvyl transferase CsaB [Oscillibacter sp.]